MTSLLPRGDPNAGWERFYRIVRRIPRGKVTTYGAVALLAGCPGCARQVGFALAALRSSRGVRLPWQRVLGSRGRGFAGISLPDGRGGEQQRALLLKERVRFDVRGRVALARFGWPLAPRRVK